MASSHTRFEALYGEGLYVHLVEWRGQVETLFVLCLCVFVLVQECVRRQRRSKNSL